MNMGKEYYAYRYGHCVLNTADWAQYVADLAGLPDITRYQLLTSESEPPCGDPSCQCRGTTGFTSDEADVLEETFGVIV